jgi:hypothetical protein
MQVSVDALAPEAVNWVLSALQRRCGLGRRRGLWVKRRSRCMSRRMEGEGEGVIRTMKRVDILKAPRQDLAFHPNRKLPNTWWEEKVQAETGVNVKTIWYYIFHSGISTLSSAITQTHNHVDHGVLFCLLFPIPGGSSTNTAQ